MIIKHKYIDDTLYLYFDYNYEFGKFNIIKKSKSYIDTIKDYIKKINYKGTKIIVMVGSIAVITLALSNNTLSIDNSELLNNNPIETTEKIEYTLDELEDYTSVEENNIELENINTTIEEENIDKVSSIEKTNNVEIENNISNNNTYQETANNDVVEENNNTVVQDMEETNTTNEKTLINPIQLIHNGSTIEIELEDYVIGVVAAEMPAAFNKEALKAQSVIARTYALRLINEGRTLTDNESTQSYIDTEQMKVKWGSDFNKYYQKITDAVTSTNGITIKYNGKYIDCVYHSTSNGHTEDAINVWNYEIPYLKSVDSSWDVNATTYQRDTTISLDTFNNKLGTSISSIDEIEILERNSSNRVSSIKVGDKIFTGIEFRNILGLRSADFDISLSDNNIIITTKGYGHGVGLSQYGANGMASNGYSYIDILNHYYTNVQIG